MALPQASQPPLQIWSRGVVLGARSYGKLLPFTSLLAVLGLLPRLDLGLRLGNQMVTMESLRAALGVR